MTRKWAFWNVCWKIASGVNGNTPLKRVRGLYMKLQNMKRGKPQSK